MSYKEIAVHTGNRLSIEFWVQGVVLPSFIGMSSANDYCFESFLLGAVAGGAQIPV